MLAEVVQGSSSASLWGQHMHAHGQIPATGCCAAVTGSKDILWDTLR